MTDEELRQRDDQFDEARLREIVLRTERVSDMSNEELARNLLLAEEIHCYYISENCDYLAACVRESAKRLSALGETNPAAH